MEEQKTEHQNYITGYLHNVSPILTSNKTKYFDMQIQTGEDEVKRGVCFSPPRIDEFNKHSERKSPVKISKFRLDKSTTSVCMGPDVQLSQVDKLDFERKTLPQRLNLSLLNSVFDGQLISIKAKLINLTAATKFSSTKSAALNKSEADLRDPHGSARLTLWGDFTSQVTEGKTYHFTNLRVDGHETHFKLDTGAAVSIVSDQEPWLEDNQLKKSQQILRGPGGTILSVVSPRLLTYRSTPLQTGLSPSELLMGRRLQTQLPVLEKTSTPRDLRREREEVVKKEETYRSNQRKSFNQ
ncbi:hypothetical protein ACROYT_G001249 [Oculina patagonica]